MFLRSLIGLVTALGCASGALDSESAESPQPPATEASQEAAPLQRAPRVERERPRKIRRRIRRKQPTKPPPEDAPPPIPGPLDATTKAQLLSAHNAARSQVGVQALVWSDEVAAIARRWAGELAANGCGLQHNPAKPYGENLYWTSAAKNGTEVTAAWTAESSDYDAKNHTCAEGQVCGHYTQVVWGNTTKLGCGMATCGSTQVWVCNYDPPGNYLGQNPF